MQTNSWSFTLFGEIIDWSNQHMLQSWETASCLSSWSRNSRKAAWCWANWIGMKVPESPCFMLENTLKEQMCRMAHSVEVIHPSSFTLVSWWAKRQWPWWQEWWLFMCLTMWASSHQGWFSYICLNFLQNSISKEQFTFPSSSSLHYAEKNTLFSLLLFSLCLFSESPVCCCSANLNYPVFYIQVTSISSASLRS